MRQGKKEKERKEEEKGRCGRKMERRQGEESCGSEGRDRKEKGRMIR